MHIAKYFVVFHDQQWKIRYADTHYGPYDRQKAAISQAIDMALIVGQSGGTAQVLVENENGEARLEWPLAHDIQREQPQDNAIRSPLAAAAALSATNAAGRPADIPDDAANTVPETEDDRDGEEPDSIEDIPDDELNEIVVLDDDESDDTVFIDSSETPIPPV